MLALVSAACESNDSTASTTDTAPTVAPTSTIGAPISYAGQATYVSGTIENLDLEEGTVTDGDNGTSQSRDGTWEGSFAGAYASDYGGDILTRWTVETGAYEGLTLYFWLDTPDGSFSGPWYGLIYPGEPTPNILLTTPSGGRNAHSDR